MNNIGYIVSLEGIDYSGKSLQMNLLETYFKEQKIDYEICHALSGTVISEGVKNLLLNDNTDIYPLTELLLFEAARHQIVKEIIEPAIMKHKLVILDRFIDSSIVYQGYLRGVNIELIETLNKACVIGFEPDLTLLIDIKKETFIERLNNDPDKDRIEKDLDYEKITFGYEKILKSNKRVNLIDGEQSTTEIHLDIINQINTLLGI
jgi:dTMP kinase